MTPIRTAIAASLPWLVCGCFPSTEAPGRPPPPTSCGNGSCELATEDCVSCPKDCPCCAIVDSRGTVPGGAASDPSAADAGATSAMAGQDPAAVVGRPDGRSVLLDENSELTLAFGREVFDYFNPDAPNDPTPKADFQIHGQVTSTNEVEPLGTCTGLGREREGTFEVAVSDDGARWSTIGIWARTKVGQASLFDIGCAALSSVRWVRIKAAQGARGELDAVTAIVDESGRACLEASEGGGMATR